MSNPGLVPEFSTGFDAGVEHRFAPGHLNVVLTGFANSYKDLIDFSPALFQLVNRNAAYGRGIEFEANGSVHHLELGGGVTYVDAGLHNSTERLDDVPRWREDIRFSLPLPLRASLAFSTIWVGRRFDYQVPVPEKNTVASYSISNLRLTYRLANRAEGRFV